MPNNELCEQSFADKHLEMFLVMDTWIECYQNGKSIDSYLNSKNIQSVIIYGMGYIGNRLYRELRNSTLRIYCCEKNDVNETSHRIKNPNMVIVTPIYDFWTIEDELKPLFSCSIVSFEDLINRVLID